MRFPSNRGPRNQVIIPPGFRRLADKDITITGDLWSTIEGNNDWRDDGYSIGVTADHYGPTLVFIRRSAPQAQDKEWLNPWD